ncbi:carbohydrate kinase family protein [Candidatus Woesearchaeota archaeon]|nr:carbohydrate kinase family protein [Candidatus Woesearchaeota archaeon]
MFEIITFGSATVDTFISTENQKNFCQKDHSHNGKCYLHYPLGAKILIEQQAEHTGGSANNIAVALSRLGHKVGYAGKLGNDLKAQKILYELKTEKIKFLGTQGKTATDYAVVLDSIMRDRTILLYKGASKELKLTELNIKNLDAYWYYFTSSIGQTYKTICQLAKHAENNGINIAFNPSNYLAAKGKAYLKPILSRTNLLVLNRQEAHLISKKNNVKEQLIVLHGLGADIVVITDAAKPAYAFNGRSIHTIWPRQHLKIVETTGAGDAFGAGFLSGLIKTGDLSIALNKGLSNAEAAITQKGAKNGLLTTKNISTAMKKGVRITKQKV